MSAAYEYDRTGEFENDVIWTMAPNAQAIMENAYKEAALLGHKRIQTPHILLGVLANPDFVKLFVGPQQKPLDIADVRKTVERCISKDAAIDASHYSQGVKRFIRGVYGEVVEDKRYTIEAKDLIKALVRTEGSIAGWVMDYHKIDGLATLKRLEK